MQWRMVGRRGRHATWTVVGDPAQSSWSDPDEAAEARDEALGTRPRRRFTLTVNYRNPAEIAELAAKVLALAMPGMESPTAVRSTGVEPRFARRGRGRRPGATSRSGDGGGRRLLDAGRRHGRRRRRHEPPRARPRAGSPGSATGWWRWAAWRPRAWSTTRRWWSRPAEIADESPAGLRVLYVALTRATQQLTVVSAGRATSRTRTGCPTCCGTDPRQCRRRGDLAGADAAASG